MGGCGSGRHGGLSADKCHEYHSVDLAWLRRKGCLRPGYSGKLTWSRCGVQTGNIDYRVEAAGLRLIYRTRPMNGEWQDVNEFIPFVETATNFGGSRQWLLCPSCRRPCRILYGGSRFRCRRCYRLKYEVLNMSLHSGAPQPGHTSSANGSVILARSTIPFRRSPRGCIGRLTAGSKRLTSSARSNGRWA